MKIDDLKIINELGRGMNGTVYKCEWNNKFYALKIEKILEKDITKNINSKPWREIEFSEIFGKLYPDQFMKIYNYDIVNNCEHVQKYKHSMSYVKNPEIYKEVAKSTYCIRKIYELMDNTLENMKLKNDEFYSMTAQILYGIHLMRKHGYRHADITIENIAAIKTNKKFIQINGYNVPTHGYLYKLIDYGSAYNVEHYKKLYGHKYYDVNDTNMFISNIIMPYFGVGFKMAEKYIHKFDSFIAF